MLPTAPRNAILCSPPAFCPFPLLYCSQTSIFRTFISYLCRFNDISRFLLHGIGNKDLFRTIFSDGNDDGNQRFIPSPFLAPCSGAVSSYFVSSFSASQRAAAEKVCVKCAFRKCFTFRYPARRIVSAHDTFGVGICTRRVMAGDKMLFRRAAERRSAELAERAPKDERAKAIIKVIGNWVAQMKVCT